MGHKNDDEHKCNNVLRDEDQYFTCTVILGELVLYYMHHDKIQYNPSIMATTGTKDFGHCRGVATNQEFYKCYFNAVGTKVSGHYREMATHDQGWSLRGIPL